MLIAARNSQDFAHFERAIVKARKQHATTKGAPVRGLKPLRTTRRRTELPRLYPARWMSLNPVHAVSSSNTFASTRSRVSKPSVNLEYMGATKL